MDKNSIQFEIKLLNITIMFINGEINWKKAKEKIDESIDKLVESKL